MKVAILGFDGPLARETRAQLERRGHTPAQSDGECVIYFPRPMSARGSQSGTLEEMEGLVNRGGFRRLVVRSHAYVYGSSTKNPGLMTEERVSLLSAGAPEERWLEAERIASRFTNWAAVRLTNVLAVEEGDLLVRQLARRAAVPLAGHDPNVQFISLADAARALVAAAESEATGCFNAAGPGTIPLKKAFRASGTMRIPMLKPSCRLFGHDASIEQLQYNWTVSSERAERELGFRPELSSTQALEAFVRNKSGARPELLARPYDDFGLDLDYIRAWGWWFAFLRRGYWRIDWEGMENIPDGRAMFVSNHRGFMPLDAVMHLSLVLTHRGRVIRFLIVPSLLRLPFLCNFLTKLGGVIANQENAARLFARGDLVGIFPEGIRGAFTPYRSAYRLRDFSRSEFVKIAIQNRAPIIPVAVIGHAEIFPILGRIDWHYWTKEFGWPYFPIAPMFPLAPVPIPSKWHVRILPPVSLAGLKPEDAENTALVQDLSRYIQEIVQRNVDDMRKKRKGIFSGHILDGTAPSLPPFPLSLSRDPAKAGSVRAAGENL